MEYEIINTLSSGFTMGNIRVINNKEIEYEKLSIEEEKKLFDNSVIKSLKEIKELNNNDSSIADYLLALEYMISDKTLKNNVYFYIEKGYSAKDSIILSIDKIIKPLLESDSLYLHERVDDLKDVSDRLINNLNENYVSEFTDKYIIFTNMLSPSFLIKNKDNILGVIATNGGYTSHSAILCRSYDIPYVICDIELKDDDFVLIDTRKNRLLVNISKEEIDKYNSKLEKIDSFEKKSIEHNGYLFLANISSNHELKNVIDYGFDGVGLYRTEFIFMNLNRPYTFLEQYSVYSEALEKLKDKFITFRTFDIGDDKNVGYLNNINGKGFNNYINNMEIFESQILAILKANVYNNAKIMFPMIETINEFNYLKDIVIKIANENKYNVPEIGMMLETKKALESIEDFKDVDFISIGTNDLVYELYQIRRDKLSRIDYIDKLIESLKGVVKFAKDNNISLSICGEIAAISNIAIKFYEIGIKNLSVNTSSIKNLNLSYSEFKLKNSN